MTLSVAKLRASLIFQTITVIVANFKFFPRYGSWMIRYSLVKGSRSLYGVHNYNPPSRGASMPHARYFALWLKKQSQEKILMFTVKRSMSKDPRHITALHKLTPPKTLSAFVKIANIFVISMYLLQRSMFFSFAHSLCAAKGCKIQMIDWLID